MAFNFNWAPLSGDPSFYARAMGLLTTAMNKSPKPPIIVSDILVTELNLGSLPPDLEVVEISDIGVDKFRGTFKMSYAGNAYITIKTRVQVNPLNTYLKTRPTYGAPKPLAAQQGLTIPLAITLSDFKLSAIIILVFSKQKGLTIVFRNDPLESLKVSSTFDSIPFVANYLQTVIEGQLRTLFMDELPAIIHRMSLRLWGSEKEINEQEAKDTQDGTEQRPPTDPLSSPPQDPVDATGNTLTAQDIAAMSLDNQMDNQSLFSGRNLLQLATLSDSHRTLSLFTPNIRDAVFRAWTGPMERGELTHTEFGSIAPSKVATPALSRKQSFSGSVSTTYTFDNASQARPVLRHLDTNGSIGSIGRKLGTRNPGKRKKKRVVNLRKQSETGETEVIVEDGSTVTDSTSVTGSNSESVFSATPETPHEVYRDPITPPTSPEASRQHRRNFAYESKYTGEVDTPPQRVHSRQQPPSHIDLDPFRQQQGQSSATIPGDQTLRPRHRQRRVVDLSASTELDPDKTPMASMILPEQRDDRQTRSRPQNSPLEQSPYISRYHSHGYTSHHLSQHQSPALQPASSESIGPTGPDPNSQEPQSAALSNSTLPNFINFITDNTSSAGVAEKAWMMKMATEVARRYEEERERGSFDTSKVRTGPHDAETGQREDSGEQEVPPPAYAR